MIRVFHIVLRTIFFFLVQTNVGSAFPATSAGPYTDATTMVWISRTDPEEQP